MYTLLIPLVSVAGSVTKLVKPQAGVLWYVDSQRDLGAKSLVGDQTGGRSLAGAEALTTLHFSVAMRA